VGQSPKKLHLLRYVAFAKNELDGCLLFDVNALFALGPPFPLWLVFIIIAPNNFEPSKLEMLFQSK